MQYFSPHAPFDDIDKVTLDVFEITAISLVFSSSKFAVIVKLKFPPSPTSIGVLPFEISGDQDL